MTTSAANTLLGPTQNQTTLFRGNLSGVGGFFIAWRVAWSALQTDSRILVGISANALAGSTNPSASANLAGFAADTGDTNLTLLTVDNATSATKTAIGGGFPKASLITGDPHTNGGRVFEFRMYAKPAASNIIFEMYDWSNDSVVLAPTAVTATLPSATTVMRMWAAGSSGAGGGANTMDLIHCYAYF